MILIDAKEKWSDRENQPKTNTQKFYEKGIGYTDEPHPGTELYGYQIKKTIQFLRDIGEME